MGCVQSDRANVVFEVDGHSHRRQLFRRDSQPTGNEAGCRQAGGQQMKGKRCVPEGLYVAVADAECETVVVSP